MITQLINLRFDVQLSDYQNGYHAVRCSAFATLGLREDMTTIVQEMAIRALQQVYRVSEVASHKSARRAGTSKINVFKVAHRYLFQLMRDLP